MSDRLLMTFLEQLIQELETLPEPFIDEVLDYVSFIKNRHFVKKPEGLGKASFDEDWWDNLAKPAGWSLTRTGFFWGDRF